MSFSDLTEALETATTFEQWVHNNIDPSIEFCNGCPFDIDCRSDENYKCPYRSFYFIPTSKSDLGAKKQENE